MSSKFERKEKISKQKKTKMDGKRYEGKGKKEPT
jgi:hypothetical protein